MSEHERIWLEPAGVPDRCWCQDNQWGDDGVEYVHADLASDKAIAIIEARMPLYTDIGQINALRECLSSIKGNADRHSHSPCGIADPSTRDCPNMKEVGGGMDGERYRCAVCGKSYFLDYDEMR